MPSDLRRADRDTRLKLPSGAWVRANELPPPDDGHRERGRKGYECLLENHAADFTLAILDETYHFMVQLLEPLGPAPRWRHNART